MSIRVHRWEQGRAEIDHMLKDGHLERIQANPEHAGALLAQAARHLGSAESVRDSDRELAFSAAYDSARKALTAVLSIQGLRPTSAGGHIAVRDAALAQLDPPLGPLVKRFDWMRRTRNSNEYPNRDTPALTLADVDESLGYAREILEKSSGLIPVLPPYGN